VAVANVVPYLAPRSQGINGARELVGWQSQINKWDHYGLSRNQLLASFSEYISKGKSIEDVLGLTYNPLAKARFASCRRHTLGLAEITAALGWNFVCHENFLFGLNIRTAPTSLNQ